MGTVTQTKVGGKTTMPLRTQGYDNETVIRRTITMSSSYATSGDTVAVPRVAGLKLKLVKILTPHNGTYFLRWNRSTSAPKILAYSAFATEVSNGTNLSAVVTDVEFVYGS